MTLAALEADSPQICLTRFAAGDDSALLERPAGPSDEVAKRTHAGDVPRLRSSPFLGYLLQPFVQPHSKNRRFLGTFDGLRNRRLQCEDHVKGFVDFRIGADDDVSRVSTRCSATT